MRDAKVLGHLHERLFVVPIHSPEKCTVMRDDAPMISSAGHYLTIRQS